MLRFLLDDKDLQAALSEVLREIPNAEALTGEFKVEHIDKGLRVSREGENGVVGYSDKRSLMRAVSIIAERANESSYTVCEEPKYEILGAMPDMSRNAVAKVETIKKLCRLLALEGYNALMLYTEDTYEIEGYPYFGHLRGRYTAEELREVDAYADLLGLEMIPCIQTMAHLNAFFEWPGNEYLHDCNDIMLVGEERVYELIDKMFETVSKNIKSRKINIGLDEAFMLGCGNYLARNGYTERSRIMQAHMARVTEICKKYGYEPRMWSDMFFRMINKGVYRVKGIEVPQHIVDSVPPEQTLVYWDYTQPNKEGYNEMFRQHRAFRNRIAFAGGDASWYGPVPLNRLGQRCALAAAESLAENEIKEVYVTLWKDDGADAPLFSSLTSQFIYAEGCWGPLEDADARAQKRVNLLTGMDPVAILDLEEINNLPGRQGLGQTVANPCKYILYENFLTGKFDYHIPDGSGEHLAAQAEKLFAEAAKGGEYSYIFETLATLCDALAIKAELGKRTVKAYEAGDKESIARICREEIPLLLEKLRTYHKAFRRQWFIENKTAGFDVIDIRIGGVEAQIETAQIVLEEWLAGKRVHIDELEAPRLPYDGKGNKGYDNGVILASRWERIAGQNVSNMYGIV